jgi:diguanylate cyclase (GGDEF)-like protein
MRGLPSPASDQVDLDAWRLRIHPDDLAHVDAEISAIERPGTDAWLMEYRERHADGHWMWVMDRGRVAARYPDGSAARLVGVDIDITKRKEAEENLLFANTLLKTQLETSPDAILVVDVNGQITSFNRRFLEMWQIPEALIAAKDDAATLAYVADQVKNPSVFVDRVNHLYAHPEEEGRDEIETLDGRFIERHSGALTSPSGQHLGRVWFFRDTSDRRRADAQIRRNARYDALTGIANRAVFQEAIGEAIADAQARGPSFAVLYLDLDQFKDVNDTLGHMVGDELLKVVAGRLCGNVRDTDMVARFGGDEFAILAVDVLDEIAAGRLADKIIQSMSAPFLVEGNDIRSAVSIGIAMFDRDTQSPETMLARADLALYRAKTEGPGVYRLFTPAMESDVRTRVRVANELRDAIGSDQLFLMYQPQVEIETGRIVGTEALVRWRHPVQGVLAPGVFVPTAERTGLIANLGHWVLREACRQSKAWLDAGLQHGVTAVNLSVVQFKRAYELEASIVAILAETGLPGSALELELTETVLMAATRDHSDVLARLRERGVRLAIDDFGVGYSSLDYLRRFPVDRIKIAQEFVSTIETEPGSAAIVRATIGLARELGIALVAEGVETKVQLDLLRDWGCKQAQGFYLARPLTSEFLTPWLARTGGQQQFPFAEALSA